MLVAGRGMRRGWWSDEHVDPYTGAAYSVLRFDNRGMPPSDSPERPFAVADLVADAAALLDELDLHDCVVVGHSMGSCIAQLLLGTLFGQLYSPAALTDDERVMAWLDELLDEADWEDPGRVNQWRGYADYRADPELLARIEAPSLVLSFERDLIMPPALGREVAEAIPGCRFVTVPDAGHWGMILDPEVIHRLILDFLRDAGAAPSG